MRCAHFSRYRGKSAGASSTVFTDQAVLTGQKHCRSRSVSAQAKPGVSCGVEVPSGEDEPTTRTKWCICGRGTEPRTSICSRFPITRLLPGSRSAVCTTDLWFLLPPGYGSIRRYLACHLCLSCRTSCAKSPASCTGILFEPSGNRCFSRL